MELAYIQRIIEGDISLFSYFVNKYKDMAFTLAFRIIENREDAEEVVQDSFVKAYKSLSKFRQDSKFSTWFYKIVVNTSLTKAKYKFEKTETLDDKSIPDILIEETESTYLGLSPNEQKKIIYIALEQLESEKRMLLTLYYLSELSIEEISDITKIPTENLKMKIHRARKQMYLIINNKLKKEIYSQDERS